MDFFFSLPGPPVFFGSFFEDLPAAFCVRRLLLGTRPAPQLKTVFIQGLSKVPPTDTISPEFDYCQKNKKNKLKVTLKDVVLGGFCSVGEEQCRCVMCPFVF